MKPLIINLRTTGFILGVILVVGCIPLIDYKNSPLNLLSDLQINKIGILSDIEGNYQNAAYFTNIFKENKVDIIIITGDIANIRNKIPDDEDTLSVIYTIAESGIPLVIIPGNHDRKSVYNPIMNRAIKKFPNLIDMNKQRSLNLNGIDIISLPGIDNPKLTHSDGFIYADYDFQILESQINLLNNPILLISHNPPKGTSKNYLDVTFANQNVGDQRITKFLKNYNIPFSISGHIHESGARAVNNQGNPIPPNTYSPTLYLNPGSASNWKLNNQTEYKGLAAILDLKQNQTNTYTKYTMLKIP